METQTISTDDGEGRPELHSFRPDAGRAPAGSGAPADTAPGLRPRPAPGPGIVVVHGTLVTDALYRPFARKISRLLGRPVHCYNRRGRGASSPHL